MNGTKISVFLAAMIAIGTGFAQRERWPITLRFSKHLK
jgi:hypothetical protein